MTVTITNIEHDIGEIYDEVANGSTAVKSIITRAENFVKLKSATAYDEIVRPLADSMVCNQVMGGLDPVNKTIGSISVGAKDLRTMRNFFKEEANKAAIMKGISLDGLSIVFVDSEDA